jgi:DME family drug/metabolite transporter
VSTTFSPSSTSSTSSPVLGHPRHGIALLVVAGVAWGTGGLTGNLLGHATGLSPLAIAAYRLGLGGLLVLLALGVARLVDRSRRPLLGEMAHRGAALRRIGSIAALAAAFQACYFTAVGLTSVSLATLVAIGVAPVVVITVETVRGRARTGSGTTLVLALVGLALLVGAPQGGHDPLAVLAGTAAATVAGTGFAVMTLLGARPVTGLDASFATGAAFAAGGLLLAVPAALTGGMAFPATVVGAGLLALLVVVPTALAYTAYFRGLSHSDAAGTGVVVALLEPLTAAVLAAAVLGERLGVVGTVGALGLAAAVLRAAGAERHRRAAPGPMPGKQRGGDRACGRI